MSTYRGLHHQGRSDGEVNKDEENDYQIRDKLKDEREVAVATGTLQTRSFHEATRRYKR